MVQGTLKSLFQHCNSKTLILWISAFFGPTLTSIHDYWKNLLLYGPLSAKCHLCFLTCCLALSWGFHCGSTGKEFACNAGDLGSIPGLGRSPKEGKGYPLQYSGLENSMDCIVHGLTKSWTQLGNFHFH